MSEGKRHPEAKQAYENLLPFIDEVTALFPPKVSAV